MSKIEIKAIVRYRDGFKCVECGMTQAKHIKKHGRGLEVHRIIPRSEYTLDGCVTLCKKCHDKKPKATRGTVDASNRYECEGGPSVSIPGIFREPLEILAKKNHRSLTAEILVALDAHLADYEICPPTPSRPRGRPRGKPA